LHNCVSLSKKLDDELAQLEGATINRRLKMMLPDLSAELSIAPEDVSKIRAELMNLRKRFAANETRYSSIMNQRASFAANSDDKIVLMCHMRNAVGSAAPGKLVSLLHVGFGGYERDDVITSQSLINLETRFRRNYPKMYAECKGLADRMTKRGKQLDGYERDSWRRGKTADFKVIKDEFRQHLRDYLSQAIRPTRHS